jgi:hypothetical protein
LAAARKKAPRLNCKQPMNAPDNRPELFIWHN